MNGNAEPTTQKKQCWSCKEEKPLYEFRRDGRTSDGKANTCLRCQNAEKTEDAQLPVKQWVPVKTSEPETITPKVEVLEPQTTPYAKTRDNTRKAVDDMTTAELTSLRAKVKDLEAELRLANMRADMAELRAENTRLQHELETLRRSTNG